MQAFKNSLLNCSASGKKRAGDYHVVKANKPMGFYNLIPPFVLLNLEFSSINEFRENVNIGRGLALLGRHVVSFGSSSLSASVSARR